MFNKPRGNKLYNFMDNLYLQYKQILDEIYPVTTTINDSLFLSVKKAAFVRNLEYNLQVNKESSTNLYFLMPFLRGLTEDYITLRYINEKITYEDQEDIIKYLITEDLVKSVDAQEVFFDKERQQQQIVIPKTIPSVYENHNIFEKSFKSLALKYNWPKKNLPNVFERAKAIGLEEFYRYFYHATSRIVHFNPQLLLRLGWGIEPNLAFEETTFKFSAENLKKYYTYFCRFYGWFIFSKLYENFKSDFFTSDIIDKSLANIQIEIEHLRWPEIVTFEELNIPMKQGMMIYNEAKFGL